MCVDYTQCTRSVQHDWEFNPNHEELGAVTSQCEKSCIWRERGRGAKGEEKKMKIKRKVVRRSFPGDVEISI